MLFDLNRYPLAVFYKESRKLILLAAPMLLAQVAQVGIGFVDTVMAGSAGKDDLAAVALGSSIFITVYISFIGIMAALNPMIACLFGAGKTAEIGEMGRQGIWFGMLLGTIGMLLLWAAVPICQYLLNLNEHIEQMMGLYLIFAGAAMPAAMIHRAVHAYASSLSRPRVIMIVSFLALLLNIPLNYVFVYGKLGLPAMGGAGCGLATTLVFWFNAAALWFYIAKQPYFSRFGLTDCFSYPNGKVFKQIWKQGIPIGFSFFLEISLFSFIVILIARLGEYYVAAQQIVISLTSLIYMVPQSIGMAGMVRISYSLGRREYMRAHYISGVSLVLSLIMAVVNAAFLLLLRQPLAEMYTTDTAVLNIVITVLLFTALFQLPDSIQSVASYALRGYNITKIPMLIHALTFWGLGLIPGYMLTYQWNMGIYGFWTALICSFSVASLLLVGYLQWYSRNKTVYRKVSI